MTWDVEVTWDVWGASESLNIPQVFAISSQAADSLPENVDGMPQKQNHVYFIVNLRNWDLNVEAQNKEKELGSWFGSSPG